MRIRTHTIPTRVLLAVALLASGTACGSGDPLPAEHNSPMAAARHEGGSNRPATVQVRLEPDQPAAGETVRAVASVRDAEGDETTLSYRWHVDGIEVGETGPELDLTEVRPGASIEVRVSANDGFSESQPATAGAWVIDRMPVIEGIAIDPPKSVYPGDSIVVTPTASDPDGDRVDFEFTWLVNDEPVDHEGEGHSFSTEGLSHGDRVRVRVVASDRRNDSRPVESEDVIVGSAHPEIVSSPPPMSDEGVFRYEVEAKDPDGDRNLRYRLAKAPEGMNIDEVLGRVEWRPREDQVGVHPVSIVVADSTRLETTQSFEVTVGAPEPAQPPASGE